MDTAQDLLGRKELPLVTIEASASVLEATVLMNEKGIGSLPVVSDGKLAGIFTERDVLRRVVAAQHAPAFTRVEEVMTRKLITCGPRTPLQQLRSIMLNQRIRHIPVVDRQQVLGVISIGDLNHWALQQEEVRSRYLQQYIYGVA